MEKPSQENPINYSSGQTEEIAEISQEELEEEYDRIHTLYEKVRKKYNEVYGKREGIARWMSEVYEGCACELKDKYGNDKCGKILDFHCLSGSTPPYEKIKIKDFQGEDSIEFFLNKKLKELEELEEQKQEL